MAQKPRGFIATPTRLSLQLLSMLRTIRWALLVLLLVNNPGFAAPGDQTAPPRYTFSSGDTQVALLELYTSEGCSSCPPAEAWFSGLLDDPNLWRSIVPVVFHVDYWDYLGWKDPFSTAQNSRRQRQYREEGGVRSVYTPGFVLNGEEWRGWFSDQSITPGNAPAGQLTVEVSNGQLQAVYRNPNDRSEPLELQVALLGFDLTTQVAGGENRGKDLTHQFVVLEHTALLSTDNHWQMPAPGNAKAAHNLGLAVWLTKPNSQQPLQATGGWLR